MYPTPVAQREWATLLRHRTTLVTPRTALANRIHAQLHGRGLPLARVPNEVMSLPASEFAQRMRGQHLAVSTTLLYGGANGHEDHRPAVAFLRGYRPVDRTTTFLIYDFREERAR